MVDDILVRYPQLELYLKNKHLRDVKDLMKDPEGKDIKEVDIEGFKLALAQVDSQAKSLPATAQVFFLHLLLYVLMPVLFFFSSLQNMIQEFLYILFFSGCCSTRCLSF